MTYGDSLFVPVPGLRKKRSWLYGSDQTEDLNITKGLIHRAVDALPDEGTDIQRRHDDGYFGCIHDHFSPITVLSSDRPGRPG